MSAVQAPVPASALSGMLPTVLTVNGSTSLPCLWHVPVTAPTLFRALNIIWKPGLIDI